MSSRFRLPENQPAFCPTHPSAAPRRRPAASARCSIDPRTRQFKQVNICFDTHHVQFDKNEAPRQRRLQWRDRLIDTRKLDETGDEAAAQGWCRGYHDINQDGKIDPAVDRPIAVSVIYSVIPHPTDGVWGGPRADARQDSPHRSEDLRWRSA